MARTASTSAVLVVAMYAIRQMAAVPVSMVGPEIGVMHA